MSKYPQHEILSHEAQKSQAIHQFLLEFLPEKEIFLATRIYDEETEEEAIVPARSNITNLVAEFLGIDLKALENEKEAMIEEMRQANVR